jgi:hypothetical protein
MTLVYGGDFTYKFTLSKTDPYIKEAVIMKLDLVQTDHSKVILFKFTPRKSDAYIFHRIGVKEEDAYHAAKIHYTYLFYPLKSGKVEIHFDLLEMVTTDEKVAYSFSGDRDNVRSLNKTDIPIDLPTLTLQVKPIPKGTDLVGHFTLNYKFKKDQAEAYEPIPLSITIKGDGFPPLLKHIIPTQEDVTLFEEPPVIHTVNSDRGSRSTVMYDYAISAKKSFDLPETTIHAFDPAMAKRYTLTIPQKHFEITQPKLRELLDDTDAPEPIAHSWSWLLKLLGCLVVFSAGFLSAKLIRWHRAHYQSEGEERFREEVREAADHKVLLSLLLATDTQKYAKSIARLEQSIYGKKPVPLKAIKNALLGESKAEEPEEKEYNSKKRGKVKKR